MRLNGPARWIPRAGVLAVVATLAVVLVLRRDDATPTASPPPEPGTAEVEATSLPPGDDGRVERVVDGDTIVVGDERVRLIGIDTPESVDPRRPVECFGEEASAFTASLVPAGTRVRLVTDVEPYDQYGRRLAYVYRIDDALFVNATLVAAGYARPVTVPPNLRHADELRALAESARAAGRGLHAACPADEE